jgi:hypothetical protein
MAEARRLPLNQDFLFPGRVQIDFLDLPILSTAEEDSCVRLHVDTP